MEKKKIGIIGGGISGACLGYHLSLYDNAEVIQRNQQELYVCLTIL